MSGPAPKPSRGFGKAVRMASPHSFKSHLSKFQAGNAKAIKRAGHLRMLSLVGHALALVAFVALSGWCLKQIAAGMVAVPDTAAQFATLFGALLLTFLAAFAFIRLGQALGRALLGNDDPMVWPRKDVDWGKQAVILDRDGIAIATRLMRRGFEWDTMARLTEDDVFIVERKRGPRVVIPKDPADEDELRERLMRGITLSRPVLPQGLDGTNDSPTY